MDPLSNKSASITPLFGCLEQEVSLFEESIVQVVLPVSKLIDLESAIKNILVAIGFYEGGIAGDVSRRGKVFPFENSVVDVP